MVLNVYKNLKYISPGFNYEKKQPILSISKKIFQKIGSQLSEIEEEKFLKKKFGNKNVSKKFLVINRNSYNTGFFSNFCYVLNYLMIAEKKGFTPVIDMENFPNLYNEKKKINNTLNSWNYYFENVSNTNLKEVYKSKNVYFTSGVFHKKLEINPGSKKFLKYLKKFVKIKKNILGEINSFYKKKFKKKKILGVLFRGQEQRFSPNHYLPPTMKQIKNLIEKKLKEKKFDKIFLCTEEQSYLDELKTIYGNKIIFFNSQRSFNTNRYYNYNRPNHRYELGREILIEMILLSKCSEIIGTRTNVTETARLFASNKKKMRITYIKNGINFQNPFLRRWNWHYRKIAPEFLGGFKVNF